MKKILLAMIIGSWSVSSVFANNFNTIQEKLLERIALKIEQSANDPVAVLFLYQERGCIEKATDINSLADCLSKFSPEKYKTSTTLAER